MRNVLPIHTIGLLLGMVAGACSGPSGSSLDATSPPQGSPSVLVSVGAFSASSTPPPAAAPEACGTQVVTLDVYARDDINRSDSGHPRPVVLRLYQLTTDGRLLNASFDDMVRGGDVLGDHLLRVDEVPVYPNDVLRVTFERNPEAMVLCGAALFRNPRGQGWRACYSFPPMAGPSGRACGVADQTQLGAVQASASPRMAFFLADSQIDDGSQAGDSASTDREPMRTIRLP